ncbi:MAG TPA: hypothetical protein VFE05_20450 [Longimicrobiaceae bacterium]|nr:hypothetical protein [Longimicrobiaceae bacterium]
MNFDPESYLQETLMPTISAYTSELLKRRIDQITREEGRKQAQVGSTALELYAQLPASARRAFLEISAAEEESHSGILDRAIAQMSRALLNVRWEITDERMARAVQKKGSLPAADLSEEEIARIAVEMTTGPEA